MDLTFLLKKTVAAFLFTFFLVKYICNLIEGLGKSDFHKKYIFHSSRDFSSHILFLYVCNTAGSKFQLRQREREKIYWLICAVEDVKVF